MKLSVPDGLKKVAVLCILRHRGEFLILNRLKEPNKDVYTPVGGKLDPYESPHDATRRETFEETGIELSHMRCCGILTETSPTKYNWCSYVSVADLDHLPPPPCNEEALEWIALSEVSHVATAETDWHIYQYVMNRQPFAFHAEFNEKLALVKMTEDIEGKLFIYK